MKRCHFIFGVCSALLFFNLPLARAQVGGTGIPDASPVGAALEESQIDTEKTVTLKVEGDGCDVNQAESALLRLKGILAVDMESKPGQLVVSYLSDQISPQKMTESMDKRMEEKPLVAKEAVSIKRDEAGQKEKKEEKSEKKSDGGPVGNQELFEAINKKSAAASAPEKKAEPVKAVAVGVKVNCVVRIVPEAPAGGSGQ